ncbi:MAG: EAL domain-containing protein [Parvibaculaceae bacterium]|nr:EAL domain-containing protein [Parvibaculaceae bacterium]
MVPTPFPENDTLFVEAFTHSPIGLALVDRAGNWLRVNPRICELFGYSSDELLASSFQEITYPDDLTEDEALVKLVLERKIPRFTMSKRYIRSDGSLLRAQLDVSPVWGPTGEFWFFISQIQDIGARLDAAEALKMARDDAELTLRALSDGVIRLDRHQNIEFINPAAENILGWSCITVTGKQLDGLLTLKLAEEGTFIGNLAGMGTDWQRYAALTQTRGWIPVELSRIEMKNAGGQSVIMLRDLSLIDALTDQLRRLETQDPLTELPNRHSLDRIVRSHFGQLGVQEQIYILYVDIDQFKLVNDHFGHRAGDELLAQAAGFILGSSFVSDVCRLGGDEFAIVACALSKADIVNSAEQFRQEIGDHRFVWNDMSFMISVSIGISEILQPEELDQALAQADAACNLAKAEGRDRVHFYDPGEVSIARYVSDIGWVREIERAYEEHRLFLFGQKIMNMRDDSCHAIEVLVRLDDGSGTLVGPGSFIPGLERFGAIERLDKWVVENAVNHFIRHFEKNGNVLLFVNVSGMSVGSGSFRIWLTRFIDRQPLIWGRLVLEITETRAIEHLEAARTLATALRARRVHIAIDDFGSGFANLVTLRGLNAGYVKVDGVLAQQAFSDPVARTIVETICRVAPDLGVKVIVEQIERDDQLRSLQELGIDLFQGYRLHLPEPFDTIDVHLPLAVTS